ncbi:hypothetical protein IWQ62_002962 [Dispira parvispora]|uniref:tripeptidyl-peptidase II n=1 Tax=Dispira parvispora TaxID=1520584 RepID=A0A9W8AQA1_9FUNG|nr:hypothetical protein IWQ62_002962 [Dispira parvispora]
MNTVVKSQSTVVDDKNVTTLPGLSGRTLVISNHWSNPSGEYRLGLKWTNELYPDPLTRRVSGERREAFQREHQKLLCQAQTNQANWKEKYPDPSKLSKEERKVGADLTARVEELCDAMNQYQDVGEAIDCVVFHDGENWVAVLDTTGSGDLSDAPLIRDYYAEPKYYTLGARDQLSFTVKIYDEGQILSIVTPSGSHGTHVAGIIAAHMPDEPELNGVAPGAQLISLKIGDHRLGSLETGCGVTRAAIALIQSRCDLANMSYGEPCEDPNMGYFIQLVREEVIGRYGCIFVASAGNEGPGISTVGTPGGTSSDIIGVGAYVGHAQMKSEYPMLHYVPEVPYTWSSRGPSYDGDVGVDIYAPGSAITCFPAYSLKRGQLLNGTSMSSPNCCGCIALLLSGLKATGISYTPYRIKAAMKNSAKSIGDAMQVGYIQVDAAWQYLQKYAQVVDLDVDYSFTVVASTPRRGIYLRELDDTQAVKYFTVRVHPTFMDPIQDTPETETSYNRALFAFEKRVTLVTSAPYVEAAPYLYLNSGGNTFPIKVDPTQLNAGQFYFTEVIGYDSQQVDRGPLFKVPITICKPEQVDPSATVFFRDIHLAPARIERRFIHVPLGATQALVRLIPHNHTPTNPGRFDFNAIQLRPSRRFNDLGTRVNDIYFRGNYGEGSGDTRVASFNFSVRGPGTVELCLSQFWSTLGEHTFTIELDLHGLQMNGFPVSGKTPLCLESSKVLSRLDVLSPLRRLEDIRLSVAYDGLMRILTPEKHVIRPLSQERDQLPDNRTTMELVLTYNYVNSCGKKSIRVEMPGLEGRMYDTEVDNATLMVFNAAKKRIVYQGFYSNPISLPGNGDYTFRVQVRHWSFQTLNSLTALPLRVMLPIMGKIPRGSVFPLKNRFSWPAEETNPKARREGGPFTLEKGQEFPILLNHLPVLQNFTGYQPGDFLLGKLTTTVSRTSFRVSLPLAVGLPSKKPSTSSNADKDNGQDKTSSVGKEEDSPSSSPRSVGSPETSTPRSLEDGKNDPSPVLKVAEVDTESSTAKSELQQYQEMLWDSKIKWMSKCKDASLVQTVCDELDRDCPSYLPFIEYQLDTLLKEVSSVSTEAEKADKRQAVLRLTERAIQVLDPSALDQALHCLPPGEMTDEYKAQKKEYQTRQERLIKTYEARLETLLELTKVSDGGATSLSSSPVLVGGNDKDSDVDLDAQLNQCFQEYTRWRKGATTDPKSALIHAEVERRAGRHGLAWRILRRYLTGASLTSSSVKDIQRATSALVELLKEAGYDLWADYTKQQMLHSFPKDFAPF